MTHVWCSQTEKQDRVTLRLFVFKNCFVMFFSQTPKKWSDQHIGKGLKEEEKSETSG